MFLKSVEVIGFKSFPDRTKLTFDSGMTAIVGPNGSGKSNISDAMRWVLGEQAPKALRIERTEDIIFAGTTQKKPLGYAQATITIANGDGALKTGTDEVVISRKYYRSGKIILSPAVFGICLGIFFFLGGKTSRDIFPV